MNSSLRCPAVIFDLDGTLTDSAPGILNTARHALHSLGHHIPDEDTMRRFLGPPLMHSFVHFCGMDEAQAQTAQEVYRLRYLETGYLENAVYPGIRQLLQALKQAGAYLGVATHKPLSPSLQILEAFDLLRYFDAVAGPVGDESPSKGELIRRANPQGLEAIMIGDRHTDIEGAHQAGALGVAALYGYGQQEEFADADYVAHSVSDLYDILGVTYQPSAGYFISLEGNDGSGKSTQARLLAQKLTQMGHDVLLTREPGGTQIGEKIRNILLDTANREMHPLTEALLYAAARAQHVQQVILPALKAGKLVLTDRFVDSSIAYQGAGRELGMEMVEGINAPAVAGKMPDLTVFLSVDPGEGIRRRGRSSVKDRLEEEEDAFHQRVGDAFLQMTKNDPRFITIASQTNKQDTARLVLTAVLARLLQDNLP